MSPNTPYGLPTNLSANDLSFSLARSADANPYVPMPLVDLSMGGAMASPTPLTAGGVPQMRSFTGSNYAQTGQGLDIVNQATNPTQKLSEAMSWGEMPFANRAGMVMDGIGMLGSLYSAFQNIKVARDSLDFQKSAYKTNLKNSTSSYNTALEDRAASRRAAAPGYDAEGYVDRNRLGA
jgi:hypothetical protein